MSRPGSNHPITAPPPTGGRESASSGLSPRHTREIQSSRPAQQQRSKEQPPVEAEVAPSKPPPSHASGAASRPHQSDPIDRQERDGPDDDPRSERGGMPRVRTPIDVVQLDPKRLERTSSNSGKGVESTRSSSADRRTVDDDPPRFPDERTTGTRRTAIEGRAPEQHLRGQGTGPSGGSRTVDGQPISTRPARSASIRPGSARPARASSKPPRRSGASMAPPAQAPLGAVATSPAAASITAKSRRVSIREDDFGSAGSQSPAAVAGIASRGVPKLLRTKAEIAAAPIDHRAGFLLAHIDGKTTVQALVDIAGMPEEDVHEILERLRRLGIVAIR